MNETQDRFHPDEQAVRAAIARGEAVVVLMQDTTALAVLETVDVVFRFADGRQLVRLVVGESDLEVLLADRTITSIQVDADDNTRPTGGQRDAWF